MTYLTMLIDRYHEWVAYAKSRCLDMVSFEEFKNYYERSLDECHAFEEEYAKTLKRVTR